MGEREGRRKRACEKEREKEQKKARDRESAKPRERAVERESVRAGQSASGRECERASVRMYLCWYVHIVDVQTHFREKFLVFPSRFVGCAYNMYIYIHS